MAPRFTQERAKSTYEALLAAAAKLFADHGYDATQSPDIAREAGVSTGAFYRYFKDKHAALLEVLRRHLDAGRAEVDAQLRPERFAGASGREAIRMAVDVLCTNVREKAGLGRVYVAMSLTDPDVAALRASCEASERATLAHLIAALVPRALVPVPEAAATILQVAAVEVAAERAGLRPRAGVTASDEDVKSALCDMFHRYLFSAPAAAPAPKRKVK
jgi:AcrR family transcriptional regulator